MYYISNKYLIIHDKRSGTYYIMDKNSNERIYINKDMYILLKTIYNHGIRFKGNELEKKYVDVFKTLTEKDILITSNNYETWNNFRTISDKTIDRLFLEITRRCNLFCQHCYNESGYNADNEITTDNIKCLLNQAVENGVIYLSITGGEPFSRNDIMDILNFAIKKGFSVSVYTNGTLVTEEIIKFMKDNYIYLITSLDFPDSHNHDRLRGRHGAYSKTITTLEMAKNYDLRIRVNSMLNDKNLSEINKLKQLINKYTRNMISDIIFPVGRATEKFSVDNYKDMFRIYAYLNSHPDITSLEEFEINNCDFSRMKYHYCDVGDRFIFVDYNGNYVLCPSLRAEYSHNFCFGSINDTTLSIALERMKCKNYNCKFLDVCEVGKLCKGGCRSRAYLFSKDINSPDTIMCNFYGICTSSYTRANDV